MQHRRAGVVDALETVVAGGGGREVSLAVAVTGVSLAVVGNEISLAVVGNEISLTVVGKRGSLVVVVTGLT